MQLIPKSEEICNNGKFLHCKGCDQKTYGWDITGTFDYEERVCYYVATDIFPPIGDPVMGKKIAQRFGFKDLKDLSEKAKETMKTYINTSQKIFKDMPPVKVIPIDKQDRPQIHIKESGIMMIFEVGVHKLGFDAIGSFVVAFLCDNNGEFVLVAQHNHR